LIRNSLFVPVAVKNHSTETAGVAGNNIAKAVLFFGKAES